MIVTASEAAKLLRTSQAEILRMVQEGEIPAYREGRNWKIPVDLLKATIEARAIAETKERRRIHEEISS
jgi:excisionase family DNA binding protein